jgi:hypothetical protein
MKVTTRSEQPQMRSAALPHTSATLTVIKARNSAEQDQRDQELEFLSLLVRVLNPQIRLNRVNEALRLIAEPNAQPQLWPGAASEVARDESTGRRSE